MPRKILPDQKAASFARFLTQTSGRTPAWANQGQKKGNSKELGRKSVTKWHSKWAGSITRWHWQVKMLTWFNEVVLVTYGRTISDFALLKIRIWYHFPWRVCIYPKRKCIEHIKTLNILHIVALNGIKCHYTNIIQYQTKYHWVFVAFKLSTK